MWQWLDNTQYPLTSPTTRAIGKKPLTFFIDALISCYRYVILLWTETQRGIQKGSRGRSQVLSWNKNKTRARIVFSKSSHFWNVLSSSGRHHISPTGLTFAITAFTSSLWSGGICCCLIISRHRCFTIAPSYLFLQLLSTTREYEG